MFDIPLFRENILFNLEHFFKFYLTTRNWWVWMGFVFIVMALALLALKKTLSKNNLYRESFEKEEFCFCKKNRADVISLFLLTASFVVTALYMYSLENSLFENYDLMAINTTMIMKDGLKAMFDYSRVAPLSFWYMNILYAVTHNIFIIKGFVLAQLALAVWLLYKVFSFIPVSKRLMMLSVFLLTPTMLQTSNIIYIERSLFIWMALSLISVRDYCKTGKFLWAVLFVLCMNFAIYVKETAILFYCGLLVASLAYNIWNEKFTLVDFIHPIKTIKKMPLEFLTGLSLFLYAVIYFILLSLRVNYGKGNSFSLVYLLEYYKAEIILMLISCGVALRQMGKNKTFSNNPIFCSGGFLFAGGCVMLAIIFGLKIAPISPHLNERTYYMVIPVLFSIAYLFAKINNKYILGALTALILVYSFAENYRLYKKEPGHFYREVAEFFEKNLSKTEPNAVYLVEKPFCDDFWRNTWMVEVWSSAYLYYFKNYNISFKYLNKEFYKHTFVPVKKEMDPYFFRMYPWGMPDSGDWLVIHKQALPEDLEKFRNFVTEKPIFENGLFEVYHIQ